MNQELASEIGNTLTNIIRYLVDSGRINQNQASIIYDCLKRDQGGIFNQFERNVGPYVNLDTIRKFSENVIAAYLRQIQNNYNNYNYNCSYTPPTQIDHNLSSINFTNDNSSFDNNILDTTARDAQGAQNASNYAKAVDRSRRNGDINNRSETIEVKQNDNPEYMVPGIGYIGLNVKKEETPICRIDEGENSGNVPLINTEMYEISKAYTLNQNNVSRTRIINVRLKKATYSTEEAVACLRSARPDLFNYDQFCIVMTYNKLTGYKIKNGGDTIFSKGNKFKTITNDVTSMIQITDKFEPALKELPENLRNIVNKIYFSRLNIISEYCLWAPGEPNLYINIDNWNRMGLFETVQDIQNQKTKELLISYIEKMNKEYGTRYQATVFDAVKKAFNETLCGENGFIDVRKYHKEYVPAIPNVYLTLDDRYYLRDLFLMPNEDQIRMLGFFARDYLIHQCERTMIITNMRLSTSLSDNKVTVVVNNISELLNCLSYILKDINMSDIMIGQYNDNKNTPVAGARIGLSMDGVMKIKKI